MGDDFKSFSTQPSEIVTVAKLVERDSLSLSLPYIKSCVCTGLIYAALQQRATEIFTHKIFFNAPSEQSFTFNFLSFFYQGISLSKPKANNTLYIPICPEVNLKKERRVCERIYKLFSFYTPALERNKSLSKLKTV